MHIINREHKFLSDVFIIFLWKYFALFFSNVIAIKTSLECKWVSYLKLLPSDYSRCSNFIRLHSESAIFVVKHMSFLRDNSRKKSHNSPAQKSSISGSIASVEKWIFLLWMPMQITKYPNFSFFFIFYLLYHIFNSINFRMKFRFWINPLSI